MLLQIFLSLLLQSSVSTAKCAMIHYDGYIKTPYLRGASCSYTIHTSCSMLVSPQSLVLNRVILIISSLREMGLFSIVLSKLMNLPTVNCSSFLAYCPKCDLYMPWKTQWLYQSYWVFNQIISKTNSPAFIYNPSVSILWSMHKCPYYVFLNFDFPCLKVNCLFCSDIIKGSIRRSWVKKQLMQQGRRIGRRRNFTIKTWRKITSWNHLFVINLFSDCFDSWCVFLFLFIFLF